MMGYPIDKIRADFKVLSKPIIYLDNACMALKPKQVIEKMNEYYERYPACTGRSAHQFARAVGDEIAKARNKVRDFIGAKHSEEIIFTRNTTESINLVANSFGLKKDDEVIITDKEHNSNLLPWLKLGVKLIICKTNDDGTFNLDEFKKCFSDKTKLVSVVHTSNLDGVSNPIKEIALLTHKNGVKLLIDGAQSVPGMEVNVRKLDIDFLAFSGHKMCGPTGTGVLYGKKELLEKMSQFIIGGSTVIDSTYEKYTPEELPMKFEAGLQDYAGIIGLGAACDYLKKIGLSKIEKHEQKLNKIITEGLDHPRIKLIGPKDPSKRAGIFSFNIEGMDSHHLARILDSSKNIMIRSGAHCVHSWFNSRGLKGSARASVYLYNTEEEAHAFVNEVKKLLEF